MHRQRTSMTLVLLAVASAPPFAQAQGDKHPFTFDDWVALRAAMPTAIAPDGKNHSVSRRLWRREGSNASRMENHQRRRDRRTRARAPGRLHRVGIHP